MSEFLTKEWLAMRFVCKVSKVYRSFVSVSAMMLAVI